MEPESLPEMSGYNQISLDESMRLCLIDFESAIRSISRSPQEIYEEFGKHLGVAWELRQELLAGKPLLEWSGLSGEARDAAREVLRAVDALPDSAVNATGLQDLLDPSWDQVRKAAQTFMNAAPA